MRLHLYVSRMGRLLPFQMDFRRLSLEEILVLMFLGWQTREVQLSLQILAFMQVRQAINRYMN